MPAARVNPSRFATKRGTFTVSRFFFFFVCFLFSCVYGIYVGWMFLYIYIYIDVFRVEIILEGEENWA